MIGSRAQWVNATYINDDTDALAAYFGTIGTEKGVKYATEAAQICRTSRASTSTPRASSTSCAARWSWPAPTDAGRGGRAQHHRDPPAVDLRQGPRHAQRQADHRRRCRGADGHHPQPGRARRNVEELARECRPRRCASDYARMVEIANQGAKELGYADTGAMWRSQLRHDARGIRGDVRPAVERGEAALRPAALLHPHQAQPEIWRRGPARDRPDPRRPARQHVGAGMGQHLRRRRAQGRRRHRLRPHRAAR